MTRDPLEPDVPSLGRAASTSAVGFADEFNAFDFSRWSKEEHPLGRGFFRVANVQEGASSVSLVFPQATYDGGEIRSVDLYGFGTYTARLQTPRAPGSITAFFLYQGLYQSDEIDIEIYNDGTHYIMFTTWVRGRLTNNVTMVLPFDPADGLHDYSIEWSRSSVRFIVDGIVMQEFKRKLPRNAMHVMANAWWPTWLFGPQPASDAAVIIDRIEAVPR